MHHYFSPFLDEFFTPITHASSTLISSLLFLIPSLMLCVATATIIVIL